MQRFLSVILAIASTGALAQEETASQRPATSNFHAVGFDVSTGSDDGFAQSINDLIRTCKPIVLDAENRVCLRQKDNGGQIWIGLREKPGEIQFVTANPAFIGKSAFEVQVQGLQSDPQWEPFEQRLAVTFSDMNIPLLIALADPREAVRFKDLEQPITMTLDVTAFTFNPEIFADEDAFYAAQKKLGENVSYAADFFIPSGLFGDEPSARATFGAKIIEAARVTTKDGKSHWRTLVRVQGGGTFNVVFDDIWPELDPKPGQLISGAFWLSAQVPAAKGPATPPTTNSAQP